MKFILTKELGRLAKWLRILGFDSLYFKEGNLSSLVIKALQDERVILTRNHRLPKVRAVQAVQLKSESIKEQLKETFKALNIKPDFAMMFNRCTICNEQLKPIDKQKVKEKVPEYVFKTQDSFFACPSCRRLYWQGTHWGNVTEILKDIGREQMAEYREQKNL